MTRLLVMMVFVCLLPGLAEAQVTSYLVSKFLSETSCLWSGAGCASGTCTVGHSPDNILRQQQCRSYMAQAMRSQDVMPAESAER